MAGMKRYPAYKPESKLPGVTEVPEHWEVIRNSVIFREVSETGYGNLELLSILSHRGVVKQSETGRKERAPEDRSQYKRILKGDIGYNLMNAFVGAIGVSNYDGIISPAYAVCRPKIEIDATYFHYLFRTDLYLTEFDRNAYGIMDERNRLYFDNFKKIYVPFPPIDEQRRIVTYINHKLAQIDQFICYKRRLIELLNEQKTALINRAVTKGLAPDVPMKHSGIEWLGQIPAHWKLISLRRCLKSIEQGWSPLAEDRKVTSSEWAVIKLSAVKKGFFYEDEHKALPSDVHPLLKYQIKEGNFLLTRANTPELVGDVCIVQNIRTNLLLCDLVYRLIINHKLAYNYYLMYWLLSSTGRQQIQVDARGSSQSMVKISQGHIQSWLTPLPPLEEQIKIAEEIEAKLNEIDEPIAQAEKEIELIQEYRTTLISDAVTGKIDVRDTLERGAALVAGGV